VQSSEKDEPWKDFSETE